MIKSPLKVLCSVDYFLPGYAGGGPIRTIANLRKLLAGEVELAIFTRDRDLGAVAPYEGIIVNAWNETQEGRVFYAGPDMFGVLGVERCVEQERFDLLYINSFFSPQSSIWPYLWSRRAHQHLPILLAPRGEFSLGALSLRRTKKLAYLTLARAFGLYRGVQWHASSTAEQDDILRQFPSASAIHLAQDPVTVEHGEPVSDHPPSGDDDTLRIIFISRISPMKNLDGLLRILATLSCRARLDIFGPIENQAYWSICETLIEKLPAHVSAAYKGALAPEAVSPTFSTYHIFAFPTLGENFGHVVFESLRAGTPVLLSDRTPWNSTGDGVVTTVPLGDTDGWRSELHRAADRDGQQKVQLRNATRMFAEHYASTSDTFARNLDMFRRVAVHGRAGEPPAPNSDQERAGRRPKYI
jgi:glycosyltransferase involved in cell wall biosynthesis